MTQYTCEGCRGTMGQMGCPTHGGQRIEHSPPIFPVPCPNCAYERSLREQWESSAKKVAGATALATDLREATQRAEAAEARVGELEAALRGMVEVGDGHGFGGYSPWECSFCEASLHLGDNDEAPIHDADCAFRIAAAALAESGERE